MDRFGKSRCGEKLPRDFFILRIVGGQWTTWPIDNGQWSMGHSHWSIDNSRWCWDGIERPQLLASQSHVKPLSISYWSIVDGQWSMALGRNKHHKLPASQTHVKPLSISYWSIVDGQWSMASGRNKHHKLPASQTHVKPLSTVYCPTNWSINQAMFDNFHWHTSISTSLQNLCTIDDRP